jgi:endonuclease/exonuclease/phosphatase (EEP) superfamily protein YafD
LTTSARRRRGATGSTLWRSGDEQRRRRSARSHTERSESGPLTRAALVLSLLLLVLSPLDARPPRHLRVLQWNVGTINPWAIRLPDGAIPRVVDTIVAAQPDVVTLQEVRSRAQVARLERDLAARGLVYAPHVLVVDPAHPDGLSVILSRVGGAQRVLTTSTGFRCQALDLGGLVVVDIHAPVDDPRVRGRFLDEVLAWQPGPVVLSGDFNLGPKGGAGLAALPWRAKTDRATYRRLAAALPTRTTRGPTTLYRLTLDHVMGRGVTLLAQEVLRGRRRFPMDHDPVVVDLGVVGSGIVGSLR